ncbi:DUF2867 domain-containing protein [Paracoccus laeviglucosivorans]|uniref:DUF2867 domain-containing protein n=1 Tax=Paracoccus laeviglucosivorans TaxID=1197861 RepID=A0A521CSR2_9RHOB|nr:DUF2867 domain-containing protein [Paracoccus laeviglucosivorans]SMO62529.1 Protein of unknown function [Paracoccus laeviglucosivorans]
MIRKGPLPGPNPLDGYRRPGDFLDCYSAPSGLSAPEAARIITAFPGWAKRLLALRNALMRPFGLRVEPREPGPYGFFPAEIESPDHVLLGFDDRHLDFRILILRADGRIHCATWVGPHHIGGRLYLCAVMPFHILILRNAMARLMRAPEGQRTC